MKCNCSSKLIFYIALTFLTHLMCIPNSIATPATQIKARFLESLTSQEKKWLDVEANRRVRFTGDPNWLPYESYDSNGNYIGITADYLKFIEQITGIRLISIEPSSWESAEQLFSKGKVSLISGDSSDIFLNKHGLALKPYFINSISVITKKNSELRGELDDFKNVRIAIVKNVGYESKVKNAYPNIHFIEVDDASDGLALVSTEGADAFVISSAQGNYLMTSLGYQDLTFRAATKIKMQATFFVSHQAEMLKHIINKAIAVFPETKKLEILKRWTTPDSPITAGLNVDLTQAERDYLYSISPISYAGDPDWLPYEAFNKKGEYIGEVSEHLKLIEALLGIEFNIIQTSSWKESIELAKAGKVMVLSDADHTLLKNNALLTQTYSSSPIVVVMRSDENFVSSVKAIKNKRIALIENYGNTEGIRRAHPAINFITVKTIKDGLYDVSRGVIDALLVNSAQANFYINTLGLDEIKVSGTTEFQTKLLFTVHPDYEPLRDLINRALDEIIYSPQQQEIFNKWSLAQNDKVDKRLIYNIIFVFAVVCLLGFIWVARLKKEIQRRRKIQAELAIAREAANDANSAKSRFLANMSHELRTPMNGIMGLLELLQSSPLSREQNSLVKLAKKSSSHLMLILNDILDLSKIEAKKIEIDLQPINLKNLIEECVSIQAMNAYEKNLQVDLYISPVLERKVLTDPLRVRQILQNLLNNAVKFTSEGSVGLNAHAHIVEKKDEESREFISLNIEVNDTGIGISKKNIHHLFNDFTQAETNTTSKFGGTGLGLSISRRLAELLGGSLELTSEVDEGTQAILKMKLPLCTNDKADKNYPWDGICIGIISNNSKLVKTIESYVQYNGALTFSPIVSPRSCEDLAQLTNRENIKILIVDKHLLNTVYNNARTIILQRASSVCSSIISLANEPSLSANLADRGVSTLNTNPLQPNSLTRLINNGLGRESPLGENALTQLPDDTTRAKLLVVDDHPINRAVMGRQLSHLGYQYEAAEEGEQALSMWRDSSFDGIITDCHMPVMDGYELARAIRLVDTVIPIIAVTANAMSGEKEKCLNCGMSDIIIKPISLAELSTTLGKWFTLNEKQKSVGDDISAQLKDTINPAIASNETLMALFWKTMDDDLTLLHQYVYGDDDDQIRIIAHRIKGAARTASVNTLADLCQQLEQAEHQIPKDDQLKLLSNIERIYKQLKSQYNRQ